MEWYQDTTPSDGNAGTFFPGDNMHVVDSVLVVDASRHPNRVAHWWTLSADNERAPSRLGKHYLVEITFRTIGAAAIRIGLDRWTAGETHIGECDWRGTTAPQANCLDYNSDWYQSTGSGFVTVRLPVF
ncbi:MAG: hypothetical protein ABL874_01005 [Sphingopyxis sp.]